MSTASAPATAPVGEPIPYMGMQAIFRVSKEMSGGTHQAFENVTPPGTGVPMHTHRTDDETLFVEQGRIVCRVGEEAFTAGTGESVALPAGLAHGWRCDGDRTARVLVVVSIAPDSDFDRFFRRLSTLDPEDLDEGARICADNGIDLPLPMVLP
jgi:quercetin dioxygenase-like cupin family protein